MSEYLSLVLKRAPKRLNLTIRPTKNNQKMLDDHQRKRQVAREIIDLSVSLKSLDTPIFPGYPQPLRTIFSTIRDDGYSSFIWMFAEHTSTHVDSPAHFIEGALTVDKVPISKYIGHGIVVDLANKPNRYSIAREDIETALTKDGREIGPGWILLFYTGYTEKSRTNQWMEHPELSEDACKHIVELGVNAVGLDAPGPDRHPFPAHKILLPKMIGIYENLTNLDKLVNKDFLFVGVPLALEGGSASPVRAFAMIY